MSSCQHCGCTDIDTAHGEAVCTQCGAVLESNVIVSEVQFQENSAGVSSAVGQFVSFEGGSMPYGRDSRQITIQNAKFRIQKLASQLNMGSHCAEVACSFFKLAVNKGLTKGRRSSHIAGACLYIVCRTEKKPLMLLDFSDKLEVDVYTLGHTYIRLATELYIAIPAMDPCLYIERYAHRLEFGEKTSEVCRTATRLVSRMSRDWMVQGRRPSGICGAALLVAARIFNFNRTIKDIMKVVRIGERTIKKRLNEFEQTPSSQLTIEEFHAINLEESMDPPSYIAGLKKAKLAELEEKGELPKLLEEVEELKNELEDEIQQMITRKDKRYKKFHIGGDASEILETSSLCSVAPSLDDLDEELAKYQHLLIDGGTESKPLSRIPSPSSLPQADNNCGNESGQKNSELGSPEPAQLNNNGDPEIDKMVTDELEDILSQNIRNDQGSDAKYSVAGLGLKESIEECLMNTYNIPDTAETKDSGELDLEGLDDVELDDMILTEEEVKIKTVRWMREHSEYLIEMKEKEERKAKELLENANNPKKKRKPRKAKPRVEASSAREAIEKILQESKLSDKINYNVLMDFNIGTIKKPTEETQDPEMVEIIAEEPMKVVKCQNDTQCIPSSPPLKKIKLDVDTEAVVKKCEAPAEEEDDENNDAYFFDNDIDEQQPDDNNALDEQEEFDNYYCDSD